MVVAFVALLTEPAEFILALAAAHVLAPPVFVDEHSAAGTPDCEHYLLEIGERLSSPLGAVGGHALPEGIAGWVAPLVRAGLTLERSGADALAHEAGVAALVRGTGYYILGLPDVFQSVEVLDFRNESWVFDLPTQLVVRNFGATAMRAGDQSLGLQILTIEELLHPVRHAVLAAAVPAVEVREVSVVETAHRTGLDISQRLESS